MSRARTISVAAIARMQKGDKTGGLRRFVGHPEWVTNGHWFAYVGDDADTSGLRWSDHKDVPWSGLKALFLKRSQCVQVNEIEGLRVQSKDVGPGECRHCRGVGVVECVCDACHDHHQTDCMECDSGTVDRSTDGVRVYDLGGEQLCASGRYTDMLEGLDVMVERGSRADQYPLINGFDGETLVCAVMPKRGPWDVIKDD